MNTTNIKQTMKQWWTAECRLTRALAQKGEDGEMEKATNGEVVVTFITALGVMICLGLMKMLESAAL